MALRHRSFAAALLTGFLLRAAVAFIDAYVYLLPGHADSLRYDHFAFYWARNGVLGTFDYISTGANLYTWLLSFFYALFERSAFMMQGVNVLFGSLNRDQRCTTDAAFGRTREARETGSLAVCCLSQPHHLFGSAAPRNRRGVPSIAGRGVFDAVVSGAQNQRHAVRCDGVLGEHGVSFRLGCRVAGCRCLVGGCLGTFIVCARISSPGAQ